MGACWRELARRPGIDLHVLHPDRMFGKPNPFNVDRLLDGISNQQFEAAAEDVDALLLDAVTAREPDVVVLCGWIYWPYTKLVRATRLKRAKMLLGMDSPWRGTLPQRLARARLLFVDGLDLVVTAGERSAEYARHIGIDDGRLRSGYYGFDYDRFSEAAAARPRPWPRQFLFTGRYAPEKDLATLVAAYRAYRKSVKEPWGLTCAGSGPDAALVRDHAGVSDAGFVQPSELPGLFSRHGAFVLPSKFEPWGVVIGEAAAAGLPVIATSACGAAIDMVRPYYNGLVVPPSDVPALTRALRWIHAHENELCEMGRRGQTLAAPFSAQAWATRWHHYMLEALEGRRP